MNSAAPAVVLIAAVARNGAIGRGNQLVFREPADQQHFRQATTGHPVVMGRSTWDSLPARFRPLPQRRNIVLSRNLAFTAPGAEVVGSLQQALQRLAGEPRLFVIGGSQVYGEALPLASELLLTEIDADIDGDRFFPPWPRHEFELATQQPMRAADGTPYRFAHYRRV